MKQLGPRWPRKFKTRIRLRKRGPITLCAVPFVGFYTARPGFNVRLDLPEVAKP